MKLKNFVVAVLGVAVVGTPALAQSGWVDGVYESTPHYECTTGGWEILTQAQASYYGSSSTPKVGDVYYVRIGVALVGNACAGGAQVFPELLLPRQTFLAIDATNPVRCVFTRLSDGYVSQLPSNECPQVAGYGTYGLYFAAPTVQAGTFPVPYGHRFDLWVPVFSKTILSGISTNDYVQGALRVISDSTFWTFPKVGVFVFANPPAISYPAPSATSIGETTAHTRGYVENHYAAGQVYAELGTTTSYGTTQGPYALGDANWYQVDFDWTGLSPGTTYHWRLKFVPSAGSVVYGADQTFSTSGSAGYMLAMSTTPGGDVIISPNLMTYPHGTSVTFTAVPESGYFLYRWTIDGVAAGSANPLVVTMDANKTIGVVFAQTPPPPQDGGTDGGTTGGTTDGGTTGGTTDGGTTGGGTPGGGTPGGGDDPAAGCSCAMSGGLTPLIGLALFLVAGRRRRREDAP